MNLSVKSFKNKSILFVAIVWALLVPSTLFELIGLPGIAISLLLMTFAVVICISNKVSITLYFLIILITIASFILIFKWSDVRYLVIPVSIGLSFLVIALLNGDGLNIFISISSRALLFILIGCWIGFVISLSTGGAEIKLFNVFGRDYFFYLTTFTVVKDNEFIRPSGIYLEPGHLIWILSSLLCIRRVRQNNLKMTVVLLLLGYITFSLAYIIFSAFFILSLLNIRNSLITFVIGILSFTAISFSPVGNYTQQYIYERFQSSNDGGAIKGDNRSFRLLNAYDILQDDPSVLVFGIKSRCYFEPDSCKQELGLYGENPLTPLVGLGAVNSIIYYYALFAILALAIRYKELSLMMAVGIVAIYAQQPINLQLGYSVWPLLLLHCMKKRILP
ncbi:hypothetical protein [Scandinavium sp.]|uniref:hypothetical protein n=1 Tax=Scandinavium sp. TaxID=2830653 RepID=UPI00289B0B06|nr:hypothetical protein [Scandinavium sp.]